MGKWVNNGMVSIPNTHEFGDEHDILEEIGGLVGVGKRSDGRYYHADMCQTGVVNDFAKFKPQNSSTLLNAWPTEQARKNNNWGMSAGMTSCNNVTDLWNNATSALKFKTHTKPWRIRDFDGYFHHAPKNIIHQMVGSKLIVSSVHPDGAYVPFYVLQKTGYLAQKALGDSITGIDTHTSLGLSDTQLSRCITTEDLNWDGETLYGTTPYSLGIVVYNTDGTVAQKSGTSLGGSNDAIYTCKSSLKIQSDVLDYDMYRMEPALGLAKGSYKAVGAAIAVTYSQGSDFIMIPSYTFLPLQSASGYSNKFDIVVSGAEKFSITQVTVEGSTATSIKTTKTSVTVAFTIKNNSGKALNYSTSHLASYINKWKMECGISGSVTTATGTTTISTSRSSVYNSVFSIAAGGTVTLSFIVSNIWSNSATTSPTQISSGRVNLSLSLKFNGENLGDELSRLVTINYGL